MELNTGRRVWIIIIFLYDKMKPPFFLRESVAFEVNREYSFLPCHFVVKLKRTLVIGGHGMMRSKT